MRNDIFKRIFKDLHIKSKYSSFASASEKPHDNFAHINAENQYEYLANVITPLAHLDYGEQLHLKQKFAKSIVHRIYNRKIPKFKTEIFKISPSPVTEGYRNKDEFSINTGVDGDPKTVGFYVGSPSKGEVICVPPVGLINIKSKHIELSQLFQELIRISPLKACLVLHDGGFWRNLVVRSNNKGETMVSVIVHPNGASQEIMDEAMQQFTDLFSGHGVTSLYYQACPHTRCSNTISPYKLLYGKKYLNEELGPFKFRISPDSFFQINTSAAKILYSKTIQLAQISRRSTVLDLCSGIGGFSILASSEARGCIGIEILEEAVKDAKINAEINNISNCDFIVGPVEKKLVEALKDLNCSPDIVGILNPGRSGISKNAIRTLRNSQTIRTLVYISCKADNSFAMNNFVDLLNPKFDGSPPFILTNVQPVDMFPHTKHCELIMVFKR